ncbi:MAG TPA: protein-glutamate O-methyltransferase CheR [Methanoregulaceae archaeon]|nr:protein-glutamate O-methyltransferase CheR [Methanoregulaceae archaeon]
MDEFRALTDTIEHLLHIKCSNYKEDYIKRRLASRMNVLNIQSYSIYKRFILTNNEEQEKLRNALTINVTKFFRDPEIFETIKRDVFPEILKKKQKIRIWSAGCSSGEEPYTYAIILYELGLINKSIDGKIYATDIDLEILKRAKEGVYEKGALVNMNENQIRRYFIARPDGKFEIKPQIKEKVQFQYHDLMKGVPVMRMLDMISCRNVTIYFNENQKLELARVFHEGLIPGGFYIMGMSEYLPRDVEHFFKTYRPLQKIFIKV